MIKSKFSLLLTIVLCYTLNIVARTNSDFDKMKLEITSQLLSDNPNDSIVADLAHKYFPNGVNTDQCLMELVAHALPKDSVIDKLLKTQNQDGSWDNIYYTSPSRSAWEAQEHIENIMMITRCYKAKNSSYYNSPTVLKAIIRSIEYWCNNGFECQNWWYNAIGVPKVFAPTLLLLEDDISPELMAKGLKVLEPAERVMTGQNKVWLNGVTLIKGLLLEDASIVNRTSIEIKSELKLSEAEGIQYDYSFHQHGAQQQFGNYGLAFASSMSYWMRVLNGTSYDFTDEQKDIMNNYLIKGINVTVWRGYMDVSSCGRQLFVNSQTGKAASLLTTNLNMMHLDRGAKDIYEQYILRNYISPEENDLKGNFTFPISKYTIHRGGDFFFSVKMCSDKIIGGEVTNNENLKGYHLADGATMIYRTGEEYNNIFAIWDGKYMPGTTVKLNDEPLKVLVKGQPYLNGSSFVGCMGDGMYGLAAMEYVRDGVEANKSWFFLDDQIVCLGNSLKSDSGDPLVTTLNQCNYLDGAYYLTNNEIIKVDKGEQYSSNKIFSDGVGYESLDSLPIEFRAATQSGDWHDVAQFCKSESVSGDVFMAQIKHNDGADSYGYVVKPSVEMDEFLNGDVANSFKVLQNDGIATAVESLKEDLVMVVFWSSGDIGSTSCGKISANTPSMVIVKRNDRGELIKTTYDPTSM